MASLKFLAVLCVLQALVLADRLKDKIYDPINTMSACFRRTNGTHQFGCSSSRSGSVGPIHWVENEADVRWLETNATAGPYMVVLSFPMFNADNLRRFKNSNNVNGVLLTKWKSENRPMNYSPDDTCPNRYSGLKSCDQVWNPVGSSMLLEDWPFAMFYLEDAEAIEKIKACYQKYNAHDPETHNLRSLCALEMKSFMFAAKDSKTCIRRNTAMAVMNPSIFCDPMGDRNLHLPLLAQTEKVESVIIVAARLDSQSLFDGEVPGAESAVTGIATLMATASHLHQLIANSSINRENHNFDKNVIFMLFNGEAFDYIGSSRVVYDMKNGEYTSAGAQINLTQVSAVIEIGQLGGDGLYLHTNNFKSDSETVKNLMKNMKIPSQNVMENSLPPTSVHSFLKENSSLPTLMIADYGKSFTNKYFNGMLDNADGLGYSVNDSSKLVTNLEQVAVSLSKELFRMVTGKETTDKGLNIASLINDTLPCYLNSSRCHLFQAASDPQTVFHDYTLPLYISISRNRNTATTLTGYVLAFVTGQRFPTYDKNKCRDQGLWWMADYNLKGICIKSAINTSDAVSPAFVIDDYDLSSQQYSTWTESVWQEFNVRMFLKAPPAVERLALILGSTVTAVSFALVFFVNLRASVIFDSRIADL